ncbi:MAG: hypothetical protein EB055_00700 [Micrococcales bacterium]|nr:hypothetical protein [Micrococcales bacterium]
MFRSKRISLLTILALMLPSAATVGMFNSTAAMAASSELSVFTVNGTDVTDGMSLNLDANTTSVDVVATPVDPGATVNITGDTNLVAGGNDLVVTVTSTDSVVSTYTVSLNVLLSSDTGATIYVNGDLRVDGEDVYVDYGTESVSVSVETTDPNATYFITGDLALETGDNDLVVTVTAADGVSSQDYSINVNVHENTDTTVNSITVNGNSVVDGSSIDLDPLTTEVDVQVDTTDINATFTVEGDSDLVAGENTLIVTVTAADGETQSQYFVTMNVLLNTDVSLSTLTINGIDAAEGDYVTVEPLTTEVDIVVETTDPNATYEIVGGTDLVPGENGLLITVTAADNETVGEIYLTIVVAPNTDVSINGIFVNGLETVDGDTLDIPSNTQTVEVVVFTNDPDATYIVDGDTGLSVGENTLTIIVTAADGETSQEYVVTLNVLVGAVTLESLTVNGDEVADGDTVDLEAGTESVDVAVVTTDPDASFEIAGDGDLVLGANTLTVTVTSVDETASETYTIILNVLPYDDASFSSIEVNGNVWTDGQVLVTDAGDLDVVVYTNNEYSTVAVEGATTNVSGFVTLTVTVTAQDGESTQSAEITVLAANDLTVTAANDAEFRIGTTLRIPRAQFDKTAKVSYFWIRGLDSTPVAEGPKYKLSIDDFDQDLRAGVLITKKGQPDLTVISRSIEVLPGIIAKAPTPSIKGKAAVGNTLTATTRDWMDGIELSYQWYRDGDAIDGATSDSYDLVAEDAETSISIGITGTMEGYEPLEKVSKAVSVALGVLKYSDRPSITGDFVTGGTVEVNPGTWLDGADISIQWLRNGEELMVTSADENSYVLAYDDYKTTFGATILVSKPGYKDASFKMKGRVVKVGTLEEVPTPVINGDAMVGETLDADPGEYPDGTTFKYIWKRNGRVIQSAGDSSYTLNSRDVGADISVKIIASIPGYKSVRVESDTVSVSGAE